MVGRIEAPRGGREADPYFTKLKKLREDTISRLNHLQDQVGREQLFLRAQEDARREAGLREGAGLEEIPVWEKASTNARWARKALDAASAILQMTGGKVGFSGTFFSRSAINGQVIKRKSYQSVELVFIDPEDKSVQIIPSGTEKSFFHDVYEHGSLLVCRNVERFASPTPLETIGKVYSAVYSRG